MAHYLDIIFVIEAEVDQAGKELDSAMQVIDNDKISLFDVSNPAVIAYQIASAKYHALSDTLQKAWEASK